MPKTFFGGPNLTVAQVAVIIGQHPQSVRGHIRSGRLPAFRIGDPVRGELRVRTSDLESFAHPVIAATGTPADEELADEALDADPVEVASRVISAWPHLSPEHKAALLRPLATI